MPYTTQFIDGGGGVLHAGSGLVTTEDILAGAREVQSDEPRARRLRFGLTDLTDVTELRVDAQCMRRIADATRITAGLTPQAIVAIVAPRTHDFGMARMWENLVDGSEWTTRVFRERGEAIDWLREQLGPVDIEP